MLIGKLEFNKPDNPFVIRIQAIMPITTAMIIDGIFLTTLYTPLIPLVRVEVIELIFIPSFETSKSLIRLPKN